MQRLWPLQNDQFWSNIRNAQNMRKTILQEHYSCSVQKNPKKNTKYSTNQTILKIGQIAKAVAHAKHKAFPQWPVWVKN